MTAIFIIDIVTDLMLDADRNQRAVIRGVMFHSGDVYTPIVDNLRCLPGATMEPMLTITVRQAAVAAQRTMTFQYGRPLERHSYRQVLKSF